MKKILLIEDDESISTMVADYLAGEEYEITAAECGRDALRCFGSVEYDLILLDLMLPDLSGMEVLKAIRRESTVPVIIITAKDNDSDKALGLNLGADDYVTKPFSVVELTARVKANIRRATLYGARGGEDGNVIRIRDLEINADRHTVSRAGGMLDLTYTEFEILKLLAANPGRAFSKEQIYNSVWKEPYYGNEGVLNAHMNRLRSKLEASGSGGRDYIKTLWGIGYKMEEGEK